MKLPSKKQKTGLGYGSQQGYRAGNFRPKSRKQALGTEVSKGTEHETSVQKAENRPWVRKSARVQSMKLPYKTLKTGLWDGSQEGCRTIQAFRAACDSEPKNSALHLKCFAVISLLL